MAAALSFVSLNIEREKHIDLVLPFLVERMPDIVCLQELCESDIPRFTEALGADIHYAPMMRRESHVVGVGIFSRLPFTNKSTLNYHQTHPEIREVDETSLATKHDTQRYVLLAADVEKEGESFRIATTHFTWTPDGEADDFQRADLANLFTALQKTEPFVLCGDFNAPRGKEIFTKIAERYTDTVPLEYTTSIDGSLHKAGALPYMVDGLFSTPEYAVSNVTLVCGVSDHCALTATIARSSR